MQFPQGPIFSEFGRDLIGVIGLLSTVASIVWFAIKLWQNSEQTQKAIEELKRTKERQDRIALLQLRQHVNDSQQWINSQRFEIAGLRLGDAAFTVSQLSDEYEHREKHSKELHNFKNWCFRLHKGEPSGSFFEKWQKFEPKISTEINRHIEKVHNGS